MMNVNREEKKNSCEERNKLKVKLEGLESGNEGRERERGKVKEGESEKRVRERGSEKSVRREGERQRCEKTRRKR